MMLALAAALACGRGQAEGERIPPDERAVPYTTLDPLPGGRCLQSRVAVVARTAAQWERFWRASGCDAPAVDFSRQMAIVHALGLRGGSFSLTLDGVTRDRAGALTLYLTTTSVRAGCVTTANVIFPRVIVVTPRHDGPIRVVTRHRVAGC
jgi:hypothetical protein